MEALDYSYCSSFLSAIDTDKGNSTSADEKQQQINAMTSPDGGSQYSYNNNITPSPQDILNGAYGNGPLSDGGADDNWNRLLIVGSNESNEMMPSLVETHSRHSTGSSSISIASPTGSLTGSLSGNIQPYPYDNIGDATNGNFFHQSYITGGGDTGVSNLSPNSIISSSSPGNNSNNSYFSSHGSSDSETYGQSIVINGNGNDNLWTTDQFGGGGVFSNQNDIDLQLRVAERAQMNEQQEQQQQSQQQPQLQQQPQQLQSQQSYNDPLQLQSQEPIKQEEMSEDDADDEDLDSRDLEDLDYEEPSFRIKQEPQSPRKSNSRSNSYSATSPQKPSTRRANTKTNKITKPKKEKTSHNMIEKRYRTNINDKIHALRDCVPSLCYALDGNGEKEDLEGLVPANKLNKATILVKATEYIRHLQKKNEMLLQEIGRLKSNNDYSANTGNGGSNFRRRQPRISTTPMSSSMTPDSRSSSQSSSATSTSSGMMPKAMMATMAGIMGANMILGNNGDVSSLSAMPGLAFLHTVKYGGVESGVILMNALKCMLILGAIWNVLFLSNDNNKKGKEGVEEYVNTTVGDDEDPKLLKHTWLTTSQQLIVPIGNNIFSALPSLVLVIAEIVMTTLVGVDGFLLIFQSFNKNITPSDSIIRAMDSQLCGGDEICDRYRLWYMFLKGFSMAPISKRFIFQAIQARLLFVGMFAPFGVRISEILWNKASYLAERELDVDDSNNDNDNNNDNSTNDLLPKNIINLLKHSDVFDDEMIKTLNNITFSRKEKPSVTSNSILDTVAELYAEKKLHELLVNSLEAGDDSSESYFIDSKSLDHIDLITSVGSDCKQNIAIIRGLYNKDEVKNAMDLLLREYSTTPSPPTAEVTNSIYSHTNSSEETLHLPSYPKIDTNTKLLLSTNSSIAIYCTIINHYIESNQLTNAIELAHKLLTQENVHKMGLLGFISLWKVLIKLYEIKAASGDLKIERLSALARIWIGSEIAEYEGINLDKRRELVGLSVEMNLYFGGLR